MNRPRTRRRRAAAVVLCTLCALLPACQSVYHTVGAGATGGETASTSQWYAFWGLLPIGGAPDVRDLVDDRANYTAYDGFGFADVVLSTVAFPVSFCRKTISVEF